MSSKYVRDTMFPEVTRSFKSASGQDAFFYGNFDRSHTKWMMYGAEPRFSTTYFGMRNRIGILSEAYAYAPYKDRIFGTRDFVVACLQFAVSHKAEVIEKLQAARRRRSRRVGSRRTGIRSRSGRKCDPSLRR